MKPNMSLEDDDVARAVESTCTEGWHMQESPGGQVLMKAARLGEKRRGTERKEDEKSL